MDRVTDEALVDEIRGGSTVAFVELMQRYESAVYRVGYSYARNPEDAMDIVQECFLKVHSRLDGYAGRGKFRAWLLQIAHRQSLDWVRARRRRPQHEELTPASSPSQPAEQDQRLIEHERSAWLHEELTKLNPRQHLALSLRYDQGLPIREISAILDCSDAVTKNILYRAVEKLRRGMTKPAEEDRE